jgi:hypothetical protein
MGFAQELVKLSEFLCKRVFCTKTVLEPYMSADPEKSPVEFTVRYYEGPVMCPKCTLAFYAEGSTDSTVCPQCKTVIKIIRNTSIVTHGYHVNDDVQPAARVEFVKPRYVVAECPKCHLEIRCEYNGYAISNPVGCPNCFQVMKVYN